MTPARASASYRGWLLAPNTRHGVTVQVATKPGILAHGDIDVPNQFLADAVADLPLPAPGAAALHLASGAGLVPAVAAVRGWQVTAVDRYFPHVEATRRTLDATSPESHAAMHHATAIGDRVPPASQALVTLRIPVDKRSAQVAVAEAFTALEVGGLFLVAGANDEGIKPLAKYLAQWFGLVHVDRQGGSCRLLRAHKLAAAPADPAVSNPRWRDPDAWHELATTVGGESLTLVSRPGMFSWEHLDEATALLADVMPVRAGDRVLDLGCGAGALGLVAARRVGPEGHVVCLDADADAVRAAIHGAARNGITNLTAQASDAGEAAEPASFDLVVTNPPFHVGKGTDLSVPSAFIDDAWTALRPGGQLALVANRTLPYERLIADRFGAVHTLHDGRRFKVLGATRA